MADKVLGEVLPNWISFLGRLILFRPANSGFTSSEFPHFCNGRYISIQNDIPRSRQSLGAAERGLAFLEITIQIPDKRSRRLKPTIGENIHR